MTSNALRNKEILSNIMINKAKLAHDAAQKEKDRKSAEFRDISSAQIGAVGRVGSSALKFANSPDWYKKWPDIGKVIGKGTVPTYVANDILYQNGEFMPSVVVFPYVDVFGTLAAINGQTIPPSMLPINEAALRYQTDLYSYNSVLSSVAPSDVMQYTIAACDLVVLLVQVARCLKAYKTFDVNTHELNDKLVAACGWDIADMRLNYKIIANWLATEIESFNRDIALPSNLSLLDRKWFLASGCWAEDYGKNSAIYLTRPMYYHVWFETTGKLIGYKYPVTMTYASILTIYHQMKSALVGSSAIVDLVRNIKSGVRNGLKLVEIPQFEEGSLPIYPVDEVLEQIANSVMPPQLSSGGPQGFTYKTQDVYEDFWTLYYPTSYHLNQDSSGFLVPTNDSNGTSAEAYIPYKLTVSSSFTETRYSKNILNYLHDEVCVDDLIVGTRLTVTWRCFYDGTQVNVQVPDCGTEVFVGVGIMNPATTVNRLYYTNTEQISTPLEGFYPLRACPAVCYTPFSTLKVSREIQDWHSMVLFDENTLYQLHRTSVLSEFYLGGVSDNPKSLVKSGSEHGNAHRNKRDHKNPDKAKDGKGESGSK